MYFIQIRLLSFVFERLDDGEFSLKLTHFNRFNAFKYKGQLET